MPGEVSLSTQRYYAHPRNAFWWIVSQIFDFPDTDIAAPLNYSERVHHLETVGVAVWDVLYDCQRDGSLDSNIQPDSERANDFFAFFDANPSIRLIGFNGAAAKRIFMRHCDSVFEHFQTLDWVQLPSTSPAYAAMPRSKKLEIWRSNLLSTQAIV